MSLLSRPLMSGLYTADLLYWLKVEGVAFAGVYLVLLSLLAWAATGFRPDPIARATVAVFAVLALLKPYDLFRLLGGGADLGPGPWLYWLRTALSNAGTVVLGISVVRLGQRLRFRAPIELLSLTVVLSLAGLALSAYREQQRDFQLWLVYAQSALSVAELGCFTLFFGVARARMRPRTALSTVALDAEWKVPAEGLATYAAAVKARLLLGIIAVPLAVLAGRSGDLGLVKAVVVLATVGSLLTALFVAIGLLKLEQVPFPAQGGAASTAVALMGVGACFELWSVTLVLRLDAYSVGAAFAYEDQAPWAEAGGQVFGALALVCVLNVLRSIAEALKAQELAERAHLLAWLLGAASLCAALLKVLATTLRHAEALVLLAVPLLIALLVGVVRYFGLLTDAVRLLQAPGSNAPAPPAGPVAIG